MFLGIDIGSSSIKVAAGAYNKKLQSLELFSYGISQNTGVECGVVKDDELTSLAIKSALNQLDESIDFSDVEAVVCNISGIDLVSANTKGKLSFKESVLVDDVLLERLDQESIKAFPHNKKSVVFLTNKSYVIDDDRNVVDPLDLSVNSIEVENFILCADSKHIESIVNVMASIGISVTEMIPDAIVASEVMIKQSERDMGVAVVDIGYTKTDIAIFSDGNIQHNIVMPYGIKDIIDMISYIYELSFEDALYVYEEYGNLLECDSYKKVSLGIDHTGKERLLHLGEFNQVIDNMLRQLFSKIMKKIDSDGYINKILSGYVLCGGIVKLRGIKNTVGNVVGYSKIKIGRIYGAVGCEAIRDDNSWSPVIGMLKLVVADGADSKSDNWWSGVCNAMLEFSNKVLNKFNR